MWALDSARSWLEWFLADKIIPITVCKADGRKLLNAINVVIPKDLMKNPPADRNITWMEAYQIRDGLKTFETVLAAELQNSATYFVSKKSIYETADLIERAENVLPTNIRAHLTKEILFDIKEAGKCIAFNLPTAAGFHTMRAVEPVLVDWYKVVVGHDPTTRNWGHYIEELKKANANADVLSVLDQIRGLHRNPLMHPEVVLEMDEAIDLFDVSKAAIRAMVVETQKLKSMQSTAGLTTILSAAKILV